MVVRQNVVLTSETPEETTMTPLQKTAWIEAGFWIAATLLFLALLYCVPVSLLMAALWLAVALQALVRASSVIAQSRSQEAADRG